ncbi:MAG: hypothetical protein LBF51_06095 [Zoogloeaceae bacterium]|jgi:tetratricopeptide (TPR) repeat protein|nr:hypothetical protein [Zoogloeaceae bacterium]
MAHPYYIAAPDYVEKSEGIRALHYLCNALNAAGQEAWIFRARVCSPKLDTPLLTREICARHEEEGRVGIGVYPDVLLENLLDAPVVAHWMLNRDGVIRKKKIKAGAEDLFFYYTPGFVPDQNKKNEYDYLCMFSQLCDPETFRPDPERVRQRPLLYVNRLPENEIDFSALPPGIEVLSNRRPVPLADLAKKLQGASVLYTYEFSGTCTLAILCGCPVVALYHPRYPELGVPRHFIDAAHYVLTDAPETLAEARQRLPGIREQILAEKRIFPRQLQNFIQKTQAAADRLAGSARHFPSRSYFFQTHEQKERAARLLEDAQAHFEAGNDAAALPLLESVQQLDAREPLVFFMLARIAARAHEFAAARDFLRSALAFSPERHDFLVTLGADLLRYGHPVLAEDYLQNAIERNPGLLEAYPPLIEALRANGRTEEAETRLAALLQGRCAQPSATRDRLLALTGA